MVHPNYSNCGAKTRIIILPLWTLTMIWFWLWDTHYSPPSYFRRQRPKKIGCKGLELIKLVEALALNCRGVLAFIFTAFVLFNITRLFKYFRKIYRFSCTLCMN